MRRAPWGMSRRDFLRSTVLAAVSSLAATGCDVLLAPGPRSLADAFAGFLKHRDPARDLGRRYLEQGDLASTASLESITLQLMERLDVDDSLYVSVPRLREAVARRIREDFDAEEVAAVNGWLLATTELQLCAVAYLNDI